ncbi:MAG TPA: cation:proton antiporter [Candidatus Saccharimonadales bacterium]|nr:cation:proton antiporter [Candidatus Saccharimonadales bacterium]
MHTSVFGELSLIIAIASGMALIMRLLRQPLIIGHILTGILVGPVVLHLVKSADTIEIFSNIGIALLLFIIGLGLNPRVIREIGKVAAIAGMLQVGISLGLGYGAGVILGLGRTEALFLGVALSFSSTIIILKLLSDKKEQTRLYGKVVVGLLLVQDILATTALVFVTAHSAQSGFSAHQLLVLFIKGWALGGALLFIGNVILPRMHRLIASSQEFLFLFAIGWGFGSAALFERAGFSLEIGALLAGVALSGLPYTQEISARLRPLRDFFIIVFFISLGTRLAFGNLAVLIPIVVMSSFIVIVLKPLIVMLIMGFMGYTKRTSFKAAIAMGQVSEFSLVFVILGNRSGLVSDNLVSIVTMVALVSIAASTYMIIYADKLFLGIEEHLEMFEHGKPQLERESRLHYDLVLFGYLRGGHEFLKLFRSLGKRYVVVDYDPEVIDTLEHQKANYLYGDATDIELLEEVGLEHSKLIVSAMSDHDTNVFLVKLAEGINPGAVVICYAENAVQAEELYRLGASYVMVSHYIGSEKISSFIRRSGLKKSEFKKYREKHLAYLQTHFQSAVVVE